MADQLSIILSSGKEDEKYHPPSVAIDRAEGTETSVSLAGVWTTHAIAIVERDVSAFCKNCNGDHVLDFSDVQTFDTAGAWMVVKMRNAVRAAGGSFRVIDMSGDHKTLFDAVTDAVDAPEDKAPDAARDPVWRRVLGGVGKAVHEGTDDVRAGLHILGSAIRGSQMKEGHNNKVSWAPIAAQINETGVNAIPIVALMTFIIGAIIAQQGAFQLRYFGAEIFVVDLVAILVMREIGVLITAIMIAGRSGSAITAEIGSMRMREEIDALTVIGLNPVAVLVFPRMAALIISLVALVMVANAAAILGAMVVADLYSGISYGAFVARMLASVELSDFLIAFPKAIVMAILIAIIAAIEGLKVGGSAESLGRHVTASVVKAIFVVIVIDGLFAIFYASVDL
jgi:phospholipid/cholesterol/gamma-HCH transport system permease protein